MDCDPNREELAREESEILDAEPDSIKWIRNALSPLLSASSVMNNELEALFDATSRSLEERGVAQPPGTKCGWVGCQRIVRQGGSLFDCPGCGKRYCSTHSGHPSFEVPIKDDHLAMRVCLACWSLRPENRSGLGALRDWTATFLQLRQTSLEVGVKEAGKLEAILSKLLLLEEKPGKRQLQQELVSWDPDSSSDNCKHCKAPFSLVNGRHHCRLCGALACRDCLEPFGSHGIPICTACSMILASRSRIIKVQPRDPLCALYTDLASSRKQALEGLPRFNEYLLQLEDELQAKNRDKGKLQSLQHDAAAIKETLKVIFEQYEQTLGLIADLRSNQGSQRDHVILGIVLAGKRFLLDNKLTLRALPGNLSVFDPAPEEVEIPVAEPNSLVTSFAHRFLPGYLVGDSTPVRQDLPIPANFGALLAKLSVLHEQKGHLEDQMEAARVGRNFEEMLALQEGLLEIQAEIEHTKLMCKPK